MEIFIVHSSKDMAIAELISHHLQRHKINCLFDGRLKGGEIFIESLKKMLFKVYVVLFLQTEAGCSSKWANQELGIAEGFNKPIIPLSLDESVVPPVFLSKRHVVQAKNLDKPKSFFNKLATELKLAGNESRFARTQFRHKNCYCRNRYTNSFYY